MPADTVPLSVVSEHSRIMPVHITRVRDVVVLHCGSQTVARMVRSSIKEHLESLRKPSDEDKEPSVTDAQGPRIGFSIEDDDE